MKEWLCSCLIIFLFFASGCEVLEINNTAIPLGLGFDVEGAKMVVSTELANPIAPEKSGSPGESQFMVISAKGDTVTDAARRIMLSLPRVPLWSHASVLVLGEKLASKDLSLAVDFLFRSRYVRKNIPVFVTRNATPDEVFQVKPILEAHPSIALKGILTLQQKQMGIYQPVDLKEFEQKLAAPGVEAAAPMFIIAEENGQKVVKIDGTAVFKGKKMAGYLNETESRGFRLMKPGMIEGGLILVKSPLDPSRWITLELSRSQATIKPEIKNNKIVIKIDLKAEGNFYEQSGTGNLFTREMTKKLETLAGQEMERDIRACISKAQLLNSDIFGWGSMINSGNPRLWEEIGPEWDAYFPAIESQIKVEYSLRRSYLTSKSFIFRE
ncbi:MAG: Ger(x)C family spore germination protein [Syntrophomonas sp.]